MPCVRDYLDDDGRLQTEEVKPSDVTTVAKEDIRDLPLPVWKQDPSYFWSKRK